MNRTHDDIQDELLVLQCQEGDGEALKTLITRWQPRLGRFARRLTGDREAARDVTQESWMVIVAVFYTFVFIALFILAGIRFFRAEGTKDMLMWASACFLCWSAVFMMKVWYWMELNKNSLTREIKRLELQIARLAGRIKD